MTQSVITNINEDDEEDNNKKSCFEKFKFHPHQGFKIKWDIFIILLSIYNAVLVPLEFAFPSL
jgi:hypothetical protein